ncbi:MAG: YbhB/YbcL family Raf kinase inhibitor-like protein [Caldimonas sp.]
MLEKLPDVVGHALRGQRAGLDKIAFRLIDLRAGMGALDLKSLAFIDHGPLPAQYTADGAGISPPLQWIGVPAGAASLVLVVEDADAPMPQPLVHAIVVELPAADGALAEAALESSDNPGAGFKTGRNSYLQASWLPPDPPPGHGVHRFAFQLFALGAAVVFSETPGRDEVLEALREHAIASGCMIGTYERPDGSIKESAAEPAGVLNPPLSAA